MKIAIFENEYLEIEGAFEYLNYKYFDGILEFKIFVSSQSCEELKNLLEFDLVVIDIDLSSKSEFDGIGLIREIENIFDETPPILILSGHERPIFSDSNDKRIGEYPFLSKPINFNDLYMKFKEMNVLGLKK